MNALLVFLGGGLGALSRYGLTQLVLKLSAPRFLNFPIGILCCNLLGCFAIGCLVGSASKAVPEWLGPFLIIGFLGGFTTFSTFAYDTVAMFHEGKSLFALANILLSVLPGLLAVWLGLRLATA